MPRDPFFLIPSTEKLSEICVDKNLQARLRNIVHERPLKKVFSISTSISLTVNTKIILLNIKSEKISTLLHNDSKKTFYVLCHNFFCFLCPEDYLIAMDVSFTMKVASIKIKKTCW